MLPRESGNHYFETRDAIVTYMPYPRKNEKDVPKKK